MADANAVALQNAINRFAVPAGFTRIAVDGVVGTETLTGARRTLDYLSIETEDGLPSSVSEQAVMFETKATGSIAALATNAAAVAGFLNYAANLLKLPVVMPPTSSVPAAYANAANTAVNALFPTGGATWIDRLGQSWRGLKTWQRIGLGVIFGFGFLWTYRLIKRRTSA